MLVITRRQDEAIRLGDVVVKVGKIAGNIVKLVIDAPRSTPIVRAEVLRNVRATQPVRHVIRDTVGRRSLPCYGWIS